MGHPVFARVFAWLARSEGSLTTPFRRELLAGLHGDVLEVGAGAGSNFAHYPSGVERVVAVEPEPFLRARAAEAARDARVRIEVVPGRAEQLPFADESFDAAVVSYVLCSVDDPVAAVAEIRRVLKTGGELRFWEHVRATDPRLARVQRLLGPMWRRVNGGCRLTRDTEATLAAAGLEVERCRAFRFRPCILAAPVSPQILGSARKRTLSA